MFRCILAAVDGSTHANRALDEAIDLAQLSAARLTVMTVVPEPSTWMLGAGYGVPVAVDGLTDQVEHEYTTMLRGTVERVSDDIPVSTVVKRGSAGAAILEQIEDGGHDRVVMGSRGRGELRSLVLGSVSHRVLQWSPVPVLVVHAQETTVRDDVATP